MSKRALSPSSAARSIAPRLLPCYITHPFSPRNVLESFAVRSARCSQQSSVLLCVSLGLMQSGATCHPDVLVQQHVHTDTRALVATPELVKKSRCLGMTAATDMLDSLRFLNLRSECGCTNRPSSNPPTDLSISQDPGNIPVSQFRCQMSRGPARVGVRALIVPLYQHDVSSVTWSGMICQSVPQILVARIGSTYISRDKVAESPFLASWSACACARVQSYQLLEVLQHVGLNVYRESKPEASH